MNTPRIFPFAEATINMLLQLIYPHLPPSIAAAIYGAAGNPLLLSCWERRTRSASEGKGVGLGEEGKNAPVAVMDSIACCNARGSSFSRRERVRMTATRLMHSKHKETTAR
jgi:hypothetical protein